MVQHHPRAILAAAAFVAAVLLYAPPAHAQGGAAPPRLAGPVIEKFGGTFEVPPGSFMPRKDIDYKLVFDVGTANEKPEAVNLKIEAAARFINMHVRAGVPKERIHVAVVAHTLGAKDMLNNEAYRTRFGVDNPNLPLLEALKAAGARIYVCGQSIASRGMRYDEIGSPVTLALSAMTAHYLLKQEGYTVNPF